MLYWELLIDSNVINSLSLFSSVVFYWGLEKREREREGKSLFGRDICLRWLGVRLFSASLTQTSRPPFYSPTREKIGKKRLEKNPGRIFVLALETDTFRARSARANVEVFLAGWPFR